MNTLAYQQYEVFSKKREVLESLIKKQLKLLHELNMTVWEENVYRLEERVSSDNFKVLILGEFKRGKSTFINALLGEEILPSYARPCTAIINEIKWGDTPRALLHFQARDNNKILPPKEIPVHDIEQYVVIQDGVNQAEAIHNTPYDKVEIFWSLDLCKSGVEIIDSPGLNENEIRQKVTMDYLSSVDAVLFVLSCESLASQSEINVINTTLRGAGHEDIFFICNRFDAIRKREREDIRQYGISKLAPLTKKGAERVFFISALDALDGRLEQDNELVEGSGILQVEKELETFLTNERGRVKLLRPALELRRSIQKAHQIIPERQSLLRTDLQTIERRYEEAQEPLQKLELQRQQTTKRISNFMEDTRLVVRDLAQNFYVTLADEKIEQWVEDYELKNPIKFFKKEWIDEFKIETLTGQIKNVVQEITELFSEKIDSEINNWSHNELEPLIEKRLEDLRLELDRKATSFVENVDRLRLQIAPGSFDASTVVDSEKRVSAIERIFATAGGFVTGGVGSAAVGAVFGYQEMIKSIIPQIGLAIGAILLGFTSPWVFIPLLMGGGLVQGIWKMEATNEKVKKTVAKEYIKQIRNSNYQQSCKIADDVVKKLSEIQNRIDEGMGKEIQSIRDQIESIKLEKQKGQANVDEKLKQLQDISKKLNQIDSELDAFIAEIALS